MKLAFALFRYFPYGGLQRDFLRILEACRGRGAELTVFAMEWQGERPRDCEVELFPGSALSRSGRRRQFADYLQRRTRGAFDAVLGFNRLPGLDWYYAADSCFAEKARGQRGWLYRLTPRARQYLAFEKAVFASPSPTRILLLSPLQAEQYGRHYEIEPERLAILPPGIAGDRRAGGDAPALRESFRREFGIAPNESVILQLGSGFAVKGVDRSLRAIAALPAERRRLLRYFLVGQDRAVPYLKLARRLGIADLLQVLEGRDDVPRLLQGADLLLHPARSESAGMVLLEAVVAGLPVLATDTCGYAFHVLRAGAGEICPSPFRQGRLDAMLADMLDSPRRGEWRENGIRYGRENDLYHLPERVADIICGGGFDRWERAE